jgi:hypothetical protein
VQPTLNPQYSFPFIALTIQGLTYHSRTVVAKIRESLAVSKRPVNKMDRLNLKKLNEGEVKEQYQVTIKNIFPALEKLEDNGGINRAWDAIRENIKISAKECIGHYEAKHRKTMV